MSRTIECICLFALLSVVGLRPLIAETYDSAGLAMTSVLPGIEDPTPATTLIIDGVIMLAALGWLVARWCSDDRSYRWSGIEWGAIVIVVAAIASCIFAGNKRLAINGAVDWLCCVLLAIVLAQLLRERWQLQLALCVILASAGAQAVECFHQVLYSFPETEAMYQANRDAIWQNQGVALDSPEVELFEARMRSHEASGYLTHSNVAGAYLVTCGLVALGLALSRLRGGADSLSRLQALPALAVSAIILGAGVLTHSRGALSAGAVAMVLWILRARFGGVIARHSKAAFRWAWLAVALGGMAVVGHGLWHGSLPGRSLDFRWKYWTASAGMFADRPLAGVGSGNFGRHYLQYKTIESPEEVKNPHNFLVSAATDWGVGGLVGMVMMLVGASRGVARRGNRLDGLPGAGALGSEGGVRRGRFYGWGALIAA
ncbi:MAG: O-antigen ligase family protein, partial [Planctomycetes bacterium]|nr:O-antigen ligase family protein [Planctomycetota bacterium]